MEKQSLLHISVCVYVRVDAQVCGGVNVRAHVALFIQHAMPLRHIVLSILASVALPYFSTSSHKMNDVREKESLNINCVFWFSLQILPKMLRMLR